MDDRPRPDEGDEDLRILGTDDAVDDLSDGEGEHDPNLFGRVPIIRPDDPPPEVVDDDPLEGPADESPFGDEVTVADESAPPELPHWADPPTGEVPKIFESDVEEDLAAWSTVSSAQPRWRDQATDWDDSDLSALGQDLPPVGPVDDEPDEELYVVDEDNEIVTVDDDEFTKPETYTVPRDPAEPHGGRAADPYERNTEGGVAPASGRDMGQAVIVGVGLVVVAGILFSLGPKFAMALVVAVLVLASAELFTTLRRVGYTPPTLVGLAAAAALPLATYWKGEEGLVLGVVLTMVVGLLWYLLDIGGEHAVPNLGVTLLTVVYVGVLGSFAAMLLRAPDGIGLLLAAVIGTVVYDIAGLFIGRSMGRAPLSVASPNKTVEGTIGGMVLCLVATVVVTGQIAPFDSFGSAFVLGVVLALVAPVGDLCESLLKRDLGVKDMGDILPGHGGLLDRFDALLFALPATYYVAHMVL